jgi:hypothetical protein
MHQKQPIKKVKNYLKKSLGDMALKLGQCLHRRVAKEVHTHLKGSVWSVSLEINNQYQSAIFLQGFEQLVLDL